MNLYDPARNVFMLADTLSKKIGEGLALKNVKL
jgi:hypothetical protein